MHRSIMIRIEGQYEITTSFTVSQHFHTKRHLEVELFSPFHILAHPTSSSENTHICMSREKKHASNYAASVLNATVIRRTCTSKGPLSDFAGAHE